VQERDKQRQIQEQEEEDLRASRALNEKFLRKSQAREKDLEQERNADKNYSVQLAAERLEQEILTKYQYRKHQRYVDVAEFASPTVERTHGISPVRAQSANLETNCNVWATLKVVDFESLPPSRYSMLPATKRYEYYSKYGFAGKGARTSWAYNPSKKPVKTDQSVWPGKGLV